MSEMEFKGLNISEKQENASSVFNLGHDQTMPVKKLADIVCDEMNLITLNIVLQGQGLDRRLALSALRY